MMGLLGVQSVHVPRSLALKAHAYLQQVGEQGLEGFTLWAGVRDGTAFYVRSTVVPAQRSLRRSNGVCVSVGAEELHRLNVWLFEQQMLLLAQLHSHPGRAYHSDTDDTYPIATAAGSLSLVIPDFARRPFALGRCAVYRLFPQAGWVRLLPTEVDALLTIGE